MVTNSRFERNTFYFAEATDYLGVNSYCTYSSINPTIAVIMMKVHPSTSSIINFNLDEASDASGVGKRWIPKSIKRKN